MVDMLEDFKLFKNFLIEKFPDPSDTLKMGTIVFSRI
jgi:hypothetical protein